MENRKELRINFVIRHTNRRKLAIMTKSCTSSRNVFLAKQYVLPNKSRQNFWSFQIKFRRCENFSPSWEICAYRYFELRCTHLILIITFSYCLSTRRLVVMLAKSPPSAPASFSPVTSTNVGISPSKLSEF